MLMMMSLLVATATADDIQWILEGELSEPVEMVDDDWEVVDVGAAPAGAVVMTLDSSSSLPAENTTYGLTVRQDGQIQWRYEIDTYGGGLIALDHYLEFKSGGVTGQLFAVLADRGVIVGLAYIDDLGAGPIAELAVVPPHIVESHDIAAGNGHLYVVGSDEEKRVFLLSYEVENGVWSQIETPFNSHKPGQRPGVDLDRRRDRVTVARESTVLHYTPDLRQVGECFLDNDPVEPHLGREFAVENGVLVYVNRSVAQFPHGRHEHHMHVADADDCVSLDDWWLSSVKYRGLNAMSIEPQAHNPFWLLAVDLNPSVRSWTALDVGETGLLRTDAELHRPWF